jgi:prevent-host-death family protein
MDRSLTSTLTLQVAEDIVPIAELKAHFSERIRKLRSCSRPLVVTQNGRAAAVLLSPEEFDRLTYQARFITAVREGLEQADAGEVIDHDELGRMLDTRLSVEDSSQ